MSKSIAFGNGSMLITIDQFARVRDIYFPYVGLENHVGAPYVHKIGVWVEGQFSWTDDHSWVIDVRSDTAYTGITTAYSARLGVELVFTDVLYNEKNIFLRKVKVLNKVDRPREIRIFFSHQFAIYHSADADTAFYDPGTHTIIHYEGRRAFLMNARVNERGFDDYSVGIFQLEGKEGTYKDAEDGVLGKNTIEHGRVDSTIGLSLSVEAQSVGTFHYWFTVGHSIEEAKELDHYILERTPDYLIKSSRDYWSAWVERRNEHFYGLGEQVIDLYKKSQFFVRSHVDRHGGILASGDSEMLQGGRDTYAYVWPRDGAYVATALDLIGDHQSARQFFLFCDRLITSDGYLMHKYRSDGSLGSSWHSYVVNGRPELPIQEDETALILWALWDHWEATKDLDFIESIYNSFIKKAGMFLASYRDPYSGLPRPSFNLWEEKFAVHTYTAAATYAGLDIAARFAEILGKERSHQHFSRIAKEMKDSIVKHLYDPETGHFYRSLIIDHDRGMTIYDRTVDSSSAYGIFMFGVLPAGDERLRRAITATKERLLVRTPVGGYARYEGDEYYRTGSSVPGNPWFITTLWFTQYAIAVATCDSDLDAVRSDLNWVERNALRSGVLSEQLNPYTGEQIAASPLTWSHSEFIRTVAMYRKKVDELGLSA